MVDALIGCSHSITCIKVRKSWCLYGWLIKLDRTNTQKCHTNSNLYYCRFLTVCPFTNTFEMLRSSPSMMNICSRSTNSWFGNTSIADRSVFKLTIKASNDFPTWKLPISESKARARQYKIFMQGNLSIMCRHCWFGAVFTFCPAKGRKVNSLPIRQRFRFFPSDH